MNTVTLIPLLSDNYGYHLKTPNKNIIIDPGEAQPVIEYLEQHNITPDLIINTHHHWDHINGNTALIEKYNCELAGPKADQHRIPDLTYFLNEDEAFVYDDQAFQILETPGHTSGHICLYMEHENILFSGDTLFSMGCGRLFEGTAEDMWASLQKLMALPPETTIYCGHEYTLSNAEFCIQHDPENSALQKRYADVRRLREQDIPSIPTTLRQELETNIFLRAGSAQRFSELRTLKDQG